MRQLRRRAVIITPFALAVVPLAAAQGAPAASQPAPWATVNVCDTANAPNTIGIRASMPGSRSGAQGRYVRIIVQYLSRGDNRWRPVAEGGDSGFLLVGKGRLPRELGRSFRIEPMPGEKVLLRAKVVFQWRVNGAVVRRRTALTHKGHRSSAGDDPPGHSAETCTITSDS